MRHDGRKTARLLIVTTALLVCAFSAATHQTARVVFAQEPTREEQIREKQDQIAKTKDERQALQDAKTDVERVKKELQKNKDDLNAYVEQVDNALTEVQNNIYNLNEQIETKRDQITIVEGELEEAIAQQEAQYEAMKERIRFMYEQGNHLTAELILEAGSFSDMLNKTNYILQLAEYDRAKLDEFMAVTKMVTLTKEHLEEEKQTLDETVAAQEQEQANMQALITEKTNEIYGLNSEIEAQQAEIEAYEKAIRQREAELAQLQKELRDIQYSKAYDGGIFVWPCPSYVYISSDFGYRTGAYSGNHKGVDMAASAGSAILAAYNGVVKYAGYSSSMGNYVWINHGSGLETIYMHASALYVSQGQEVSAGQNIAAVGTTGWSTGNHLHFQVMLNGTAVSPWGYIADPR